MTQLTSKVIEALGYRWHLTACDIDAEDGRVELQGLAQRYLNGITRPAHKANLNFMLFPYYADILASLEKLETLDDNPKDVTSLSYDWAGDVAEWVAFVKKVKAEGKAGELSDLWDAAQRLNPEWYPGLEQSMAALDEETQKAAANLDKIGAFVENPDDSPHPDTAQAQADSKRVMLAVEKEAEEAGKIGPATFHPKRKGAA